MKKNKKNHPLLLKIIHVCLFVIMLIYSFGGVTEPVLESFGINPKTVLLYSFINGAKVTEVDILQQHINRILQESYTQAAGPVDGIFGPLTKQGVERLQMKLNELLEGKIVPLVIDGIVGPFTRFAINNSC